MRSFILQGPISEHTKLSCDSIRTHFPNDEIIVSSYKRSDASGLSYDKLVLIDDPGPLITPKKFVHINRAHNNVNRQIATSLAGIQAASNDLVCRLRSDIVFTGTASVKYFDLYPKCDESCRLFDRKVVIPHMPTSSPHACLLHPSDYFFYGLKSDLLKIFDIPHNAPDQQHYVPENYIFIKCVQKKIPWVDINHPFDRNPDLQTLTLNLFRSNFIVIDMPHQSEFYCAKYTDIKPPEHYGAEYIGHRRWLDLYSGLP